MKKLEKKLAIGLFILLSLSILVLSLFLGCDYFFGSYFPAYLSEVEKVLDLEDRLTAASYDHFTLKVMNNNLVDSASTDEYVFLTCFPKDRNPVLYVINTELTIIDEYEAGGFDHFHMVRASGSFIAGGYEVSANGVINGATVSTSGSHGFAYSPGTEYGVATSTDPPNYNCSNRLFYDPLGSLTGAYSITIDENIGKCFRLEGAVNDSQRSARPLVLTFSSENDESSAYAFACPPFPLPSPSPSLIADTSIPRVIVNDVDTHRVSMYYTRAGLVVNHDNNIRKLYNLDTGAEIDSATHYNEDWLETDYDLAGNYYYIFDKKEKQLYKCHTWWKK